VRVANRRGARPAGLRLRTRQRRYAALAGEHFRRQGRRRSSRSCRVPRVGALYVALDQFLEFLSDPIALERHCLRAILVDRCHRMFAGSGQADADVGVLALARAVTTQP